MFEAVATQPKPKSTQRNPNDGRVLAEIEKWMDMIREIKSEQGEELTAAGQELAVKVWRRSTRP